MSEKFIETLKGIFAIVLLLLYVYVIYTLLDCLYLTSAQSGCVFSKEEYKTLMWLSQSFGALISAVVISVLAISEYKSGKFRFYTHLRNNAQKISKFVKILMGIYVITWLLTGAAFVVCFIKFPDVDESINNFARGFLGLFLGAVYSLFGIEPNNGK